MKGIRDVLVYNEADVKVPCYEIGYSGAVLFDDALEVSAEKQPLKGKKEILYDDSHHCPF